MSVIPVSRGGLCPFGLGSPCGNVSSLCFHTSNCTFFILGGKEEGSQFLAGAQSEALLNTWQVAQRWGSIFALTGEARINCI